jgi:catechol 2,3-dioxygenase-like lactoylglutathione lyase family enzyme
MPVRFVSVCVDAADPDRLARFWAVALHGTIERTDDVVAVTSDGGSGVRVEFVEGPARTAERNRIHFDLTTTSLTDQNETVTRLLALGAHHLDVGQSDDETHVVLADPEGNELCVIEPGNRFLAGCGRLGAINCDGLRRTGVFWSEALGWPLIWDQDDETAVRSPWQPGVIISWSGPPLLPKPGKNHLHLHVAAPTRDTMTAAVERLVALGATPVDIGQRAADRVVLADPDGNELCLVPPS